MKNSIDTSSPAGWFDAVVVIMLVFGFFRGRKHGMSQEILLVLQWLLIVFIGGHYYEPLSKLIYDFGLFGPWACNMFVYVGIAIALKILFVNLKRFIGEKIFSSDVFGRWEFYLGMVAGVVRYACMVIFILSLVNGKAYTQQEIVDADKKQTADFGSTFFPSLPKMQDQILRGSFAGTTVRKSLGPVLLKPTSMDDSAKKTEGPARKRESAVDEAITGKPAPKK